MRATCREGFTPTMGGGDLQDSGKDVGIGNQNDSDGGDDDGGSVGGSGGGASNSSRGGQKKRNMGQLSDKSTSQRQDIMIQKGNKGSLALREHERNRQSEPC